MIPILILLLNLAYAEEPPTLSIGPPHVIELPQSAAVTNLDGATIQRKNRESLAEVLRDVPGLDVVAAGGAGQPTAIFIRGARSEDTLLLIDGIAANESMSPGGGFNFANLDADNIERVEVYRGPQGVRFGSGAVGGVINVITKRGHGPGQVAFSAEGGTYSTDREAAGYSAERGHWNYSLGAGHFRSAGFSAADERDGNRERDGSERYSLSSHLGWRGENDLAVDFVTRYWSARTDLDLAGGVGGDAPDDVTKFNQRITGLTLNKSLLGQRMRLSATAGSTTVTRDQYRGDTFIMEGHLSYALTRAQTLQTGYEFQRENGAGRIARGGISTAYLFDDGQFFAEAGVRRDEYTGGPAVPTERAVAGWRIGHRGPTLQFIYGTGFKVPSLYQLYSAMGNFNLSAQRDRSYELSLEQKFSSILRLTLDLFENQYRDLIDFNFATNSYVNVASAHSRGAEASVDGALTEDLHVLASLKYLESRDDRTGETLLRRAGTAWSIESRFARRPFDLNLRYRFVSAREDLDPVGFSRITLAQYGILSFGGSLLLAREFYLTARIENILDKKYQEVAGYGTAGLAFYGGLRGGF